MVRRHKSYHEEVKEAAYHEAGHTVLFLYLRVKIKDVAVTVDDDGGSDGITRILEGQHPLSPVHDAMVGLAGFIASKLFTDIGDAENFFTSLSDLTTAVLDLGRAAIRLVPDVRQILEENQKAVAAMAHELMVTHYLTGERAEQLYQENGGTYAHPVIDVDQSMSLAPGSSMRDVGERETDNQS